MPIIQRLREFEWRLLKKLYPLQLSQLAPAPTVADSFASATREGWTSLVFRTTKDGRSGVLIALDGPSTEDEKDFVFHGALIAKWGNSYWDDLTLSELQKDASYALHDNWIRAALCGCIGLFVAVVWLATTQLAVFFWVLVSIFATIGIGAAGTALYLGLDSKLMSWTEAQWKKTQLARDIALTQERRQELRLKAEASRITPAAA